jgi:hypothetical protein
VKVRAVQHGLHAIGVSRSKSVRFSPVTVIQPVPSAKPCNLIF